MNNCNSICQKFVAKKPLDGGRYANGQKRCNFCSKFILWGGIFCPCCGCKLRNRTRTKNLREKFLAIKRI